MPRARPPSFPRDALSWAARLSRRNRWKALRQRSRVIVPVAVAAAGLLSLSALSVHHVANTIGDFLDGMFRLPVAVIVVAGWVAMLLTSRHRRRAVEQARRSWLAALPLQEGRFERQALSRAVGTLTLMALVAGIPVAVGASAAQWSIRQLATLALLLLVGTALGLILGWAWGRRGAPSPSPRRWAPGFLRRTGDVLGHWPLQHARASADLGLHARTLGALLLAMPAGTPATTAMSLIVIGSMALLVWGLVRALLTTTRQGGPWLRSLPWPPFRAILALGTPALGSMVMALSLAAVGLPMIVPGIAAGRIAFAVLITSLALTAVFAITCIAQRPFQSRR